MTTKIAFKINFIRILQKTRF